MFNWTRINGYYINYANKTHGLHPGLTTIIGPNESGKSSIIELGFRYALFGTAALRRPSADYKTLEVETSFVVRGATYRVLRSPKVTRLFDADDTPLATGVGPVNAAIVALLGYGLKVFDIANCCNQNQVLAFSDRMRPTERRLLIDQTIGLSAIDEVSTTLMTELTDLTKEVKILQNRWVDNAPVKPEAPTGYCPSEALRPEVTAAESAARDYNSFQFALTQPAVVEPTPPMQPFGYNWKLTMDDVRSRHNQLGVIAQRRRYLLGVLSVTLPTLVKPEPVVESIAIDLLEASETARKALPAYRLSLQRLELPALTPAEIEAHQDALELYNRVLQKQQLLKHGDSECPNCHHIFPNEHRALEHYADVPDTMDRPSITIDYLARQRLLQDNVQKKEELLRLVASGESQLVENDAEWLGAHRSYSQRLQVYEAQLAASQKHAEDQQGYRAELAALDDPTSELAALADELQKREQYTHELRAYENARLSYLRDQQGRKHLQERMAEVKDTALMYPFLRQALENSLKYEEAYKGYTKFQEMYERDTAKIEQLQTDIANLKAGVKALADLKVLIKTFLLPSLNRVASLLLQEMTGGARKEILLTDTFEILVDATPIEALSGSAQAVANLALRLGLGQVLTNKTFSVFLGDELDASMDINRANFLMACLQRLKGQIKQIVLVTHKADLPADHTIQLG